MSVLIVGDLHLGKGCSLGKPGIGNYLNSRIIDQVKLLDWVVDKAIENSCTAIIFTGDICEHAKPDYVLIEIFIQVLKRCKAHSIGVHIIAGNHDLQRTGTKWFSYLDLISSIEMDNVCVYKNISTLEIDDTIFTLLPFRDIRSLSSSSHEEALEIIKNWLTYESVSISPDKTKVLVGHLAIEGSIYIGDEIDNPSVEIMCPIDMFHEYDFTFMGHIHKPQELSDDPYVSHVGSLDISDFGETDHTKIIILFDNSTPEKFVEIPVPSRPLRHIVSNIPSDQDATAYTLKQIKAIHNTKSLNGAIVKIDIKILDDATEGSDRDYLEQQAYDLGAFHVILKETRSLNKESILDQQIQSNEISPKKAVDIYANSKEFLNDQEKEMFISFSKEIIHKVGEAESQ